MPRLLKSRTACHRCRQRRIKCNEQKPKYDACAKHHLNCTWPASPHQPDIWPFRSASKEVHAKLLLHDKYCQLPADLTLVVASTNCPVKSVSAGYPPLQDEAEYRLLTSLAAWQGLHAESDPNQGVSSGATFEFTVALEEPWVRSSLLAASAVVQSAHKLGPRSAASPYYSAAFRHVYHRLSAPRGRRENEELLVATLYLDLMDVGTVPSKVQPHYCYVVVGQCLRDLGMMDSDLMSKDLNSLSPSLWHQRLSYEWYLVVMSKGIFRHPKRYKSVRLVAPSACAIGNSPSSAKLNSTAPLDINALYILYETTRLYHSPRSAETTTELQIIKDALQTLQRRHQQDVVPGDGDSLHTQFQVLTLAALGALQIYCAKALDHSLTASSPEIQRHRDLSFGQLNLWPIKSLWPGYLIWIPSILLCAAKTDHDVRTVCTKIDDLLPNVFSENLEHLKKLMEALNLLQGPNGLSMRQPDGLSSRITDPLCLMFSPL